MFYKKRIIIKIKHVTAVFKFCGFYLFMKVPFFPDQMAMIARCTSVDVILYLCIEEVVIS